MTTQDNTSNQQPGKYKVTVMRDKCIGCASCTAIAADTFKLDDEGISTVISQEGDDATKLLAAQSCPTGAIAATDAKTGDPVWPLSE